MSSQFFNSIIEKFVKSRLQGKKLDKRQKRTLDIITAIEEKSKALKGTFEVRYQEIDPETDTELENIAEAAANKRVEEILDNIIETSFFDYDSKTVIKNKTKVDVFPPLRGLKDKNNRAIGARDLITLLNLSLHDHIKSFMGTQGRLVYRTGRLANSANVTGLDLDNKLSVFFNYQTAPYSVFESGGKMFKPGRPPSDLIRDSILKALRYYLSKDSFASYVSKNNIEWRD